jgi:protein LSM14
VPTPKDDFDFESNLAEFEKARIGNDESDEDSDYDDEEEDDMDGGPASNAYSKDDFFDSISCDAIDKRDGVDNRLRGAAERNLNTETFGAVALGNGRRGGRRSRRGGGRGGRGRGRGREGGRRSYEGAPTRENNRWKKVGDSERSSTAQAASGSS